MTEKEAPPGRRSPQPEHAAGGGVIGKSVIGKPGEIRRRKATELRRTPDG